VDRRDEILDAVRRCAAANGGVPLGRQRFESETGIRESEWSGRYWTRWGDLVRDAGFEPSRMQGRHDDHEILDRLADLTAALGRLPTRPELKLQRRSDSTFPSPNVFDRFGRRHELAAALAEHCRRGGRDAVVSICQPLIQEPADEPAADRGNANTGFVYLMKSGKHYKVGRTNAVGRRLYEMKIQLPERVELVHSFETDDPEGIERYWHGRFADRRTNGEWFLLTREDVAAFRRRSKFM
jgi:hypothetical protein